MPIPRPPQGVRWLFTQTAAYDVLIAIFASVIGFSSAWNYWTTNRWRLATIVFCGTVGVVAVTVCKHIIGLAAARKKDSTHELEGCLYTLHAVLDPSNLDPPVTLRLAVHVPVAEMLEQVTDYVGVTPKSGRIGRRFPANAGIIGKAYRENVVLVGRRANDDYELYLQELITEWNYTPDQARRSNPAAMEWMAVPFYDADHDRVEAILYLDASKRDFFTPARQEVVLRAVSGIAVFVGKRYS